MDASRTIYSSTSSLYENCRSSTKRWYSMQNTQYTYVDKLSMDSGPKCVLGKHLCPVKKDSTFYRSRPHTVPSPILLAVGANLQDAVARSKQVVWHHEVSPPWSSPRPRFLGFEFDRIFAKNSISSRPWPLESVITWVRLLNTENRRSLWTLFQRLDA